MHKITEDSKKSPVIHDNVVVDNVVDCEINIPASNSNNRIRGPELNRETANELTKVRIFIFIINN